MFIESKKIRKSYGKNESANIVLKDISMKVEKGSVCVILGPSGSGKSTLLNVLGGIDSVDSGSLSVAGQNLDKMDQKQLSLYRKDNLGFIFQFYNLVPNLTLEENIMVGGELSENPLDVEMLLSWLDLSEHRKKFPSQLSGGQQQRCSIARALAKNPKLLLCDEPTGALDYSNSRQILRLLEAVNRKFGTTIIIVTHNSAFRGMADQVITLRDGVIEEDIQNENIIPADEIEW